MTCGGPAGQVPPVIWPRLHIPTRWRDPTLPLLWSASLAFNIAALVLPFLRMRSGMSWEPYSLEGSVRFLWESHLYVLAAVVVLFSILFPFFKLGVLAAVWLGAIGEAKEGAWLAMVERYGKWSMLDVFLVCIMLALANDQLLVDAAPRAGLSCFTLAILLSMVCSRRMLARIGHRRAPLRLQIRHPGWRAVGQTAVLALLVAVLWVPFLEIDDWWLEDHPVSLLSTIADLWESGARSLAVIAASFLVVAPVCGCLASIGLLLALRRGRDGAGWTRIASRLEHWAMLDVFALALGIFLVEGNDFVRTELTWGAFLLALALAVYWPASIWYARRD